MAYEFSEQRKDATPSTASLHEAFRGSLPFDDGGDHERATRGLLSPSPERQIIGRFAHAVWDLDAFAFEHDAVAPPTANPSLWRQARLNNAEGLFEVMPGIYQVRGLDISNITYLETNTGWVVIDPLTSKEAAALSKSMIDSHFGARPIHAVIYTHSHTDHYGGVKGVIDESDVLAGKVELIAPAGFLEAVISENILAGTPMLRRATYMYGALLPKDAKGHIDTGLGKGLPAMPIVDLLAPTREIHETGEELLIDGLRMVFQITPGTEAPAEMNIYFPDHRALCMAENCTATMHNLYTLRGAQVRDALGWSKYIDEALEIYGSSSDVMFASHHWPRWGTEEVAEYLASQRDSYRYVHDQTLRMANLGLTMNEIAEEIVRPPSLGNEWFNRDYYGTISHNAKAVYQRYLGWFDGNPAHLNPHPPVAAAERYVEFMGGADAILEKATVSFAEGDYRWVAEVVNHVVFADPSNERARFLQADALEQLGYQSESGPWRDFYLTGAQELRANGTMLRGIPGNALGQGIVRSMTADLLVDLIGIRLNGQRASGHDITIHLTVRDRDAEEWTVVVRRSAVHARRSFHGQADCVITATIEGFAGVAAGNKTLNELIDAEQLSVMSGGEILETFIGLLDTFEFGFEIVLP
jgi:alkyl sulfatase BDS1-like metallo-beta-lactamase superfamily hydrolase